MKPLNTWKKTLLPAALALALIIPASAFADDAPASNSNGGASGAANSAPAKRQMMHAPGKGPGFGPGGFGMHRIGAAGGSVSVNEHKYIELLAEKYAPSTLADWKAAFAEQQSLRDQLTALFQDQGVQNQLKAEQESRMKAQKDQMKKMKEERKKQAENGQQPSGQQKQRSAPGQGRMPGMTPGNGGQPAFSGIANDIKNRRALTEAVKADNAEAIGSALAALLQDLKKANEQTAAKAAQLKPYANGQKAERPAPQAGKPPILNKLKEKKSQKDEKRQKPSKSQPKSDSSSSVDQPVQQ